MYIPYLLIHLSVNAGLGCFCLLTVINNAVMNMGLQISIWDISLSSFEGVPRSKIAESYVNSISFFFEETRYCFHCGYILLNSHQQCTIFWFLYIFSNACYFLFLFICLVGWIAAIPVSMQYYLIAVLICISLMTSDDNLLFMNVLTISISSEKWLLSDYFWVKLFVL